MEKIGEEIGAPTSRWRGVTLQAIRDNPNTHDVYEADLFDSPTGPWSITNPLHPPSLSL